jgi:hypothetical protein
MIGIGFLQFCIPGVLTFQANNITTHSKRAVASATCLIGGGVGGVIASSAFKSSESPQYTVSTNIPCQKFVHFVHFAACCRLYDLANGND